MKKLKARLLKVKTWLKQNKHMRLVELIERLNSKLIWHYRYFGITDKFKFLGDYKYTVTRYLFKWLYKRSQRKGFHRDKYILFLEKFPLAKLRIYLNIYGIRNNLDYIM